MLECPWIRGALSLAGSHQPRHTPFQSNLFRKRPPFIKSQPLQTTGAFNKTPSMFRRPPLSAQAEQGAAIIATTFHSVQPLRRGAGWGAGDRGEEKERERGKREKQHSHPISGKSFSKAFGVRWSGVWKGKVKGHP